MKIFKKRLFLVMLIFPVVGLAEIRFNNSKGVNKPHLYAGDSYGSVFIGVGRDPDQEYYFSSLEIKSLIPPYGLNKPEIKYQDDMSYLLKQQSKHMYSIAIDITANSEYGFNSGFFYAYNSYLILGPLSHRVHESFFRMPDVVDSLKKAFSSGALYANGDYEVKTLEIKLTDDGNYYRVIASWEQDPKSVAITRYAYFFELQAGNEKLGDLSLYAGNDSLGNLVTPIAYASIQDNSGDWDFHPYYGYLKGSPDPFNMKVYD